jgi:hypothetical protein
MNISDIRAKYPQYKDLSDGELLDGLHGKFYSDMPKEEFMRSVGYAPQSRMQMLKDEALTSVPGGFVRGVKDVIDTGASYLSRLGGDDEARQVQQMNAAGKRDFEQAQERTGNNVFPSIARVGGNIATTWPIAGVLGGAANAVGLTRLGNALASGGMTTGAARTPGVLGGAADMGIRVAGGAGTGFATAGMVDPEAAPLGAAVGGALPVVARVGGAIGHTVGNAVSDSRAARTAADKIAQTLGGRQAAQNAIADIQTYFPRGAENIPLSSAAVTRNPALAQLEQGSRLNASPLWHQFDQRQGRAVFDNVTQATQEAAELGARKAARAENWKAAWDAASNSAKPRVWQSRMTQLWDDLDVALQTPEASNPAVRGVIDAVKGEIDRLGPMFGPGNLQQLRANLSGKANTMSPDAFKSAPRDSPAIISLMKEMDDILNHTTGGKWQKVIEGYAKDSEKVRSAAAASKVRGAFVDSSGNLMKKSLDAAGDVPIVTEAGLRGALNAAKMPDGSIALSPAAQQRVNATMDALQRQSMVQQLKRSATAGGGSDTVSNAIASGAARQVGAPNLLLQLLDATRKVGMGRVDNQMAGLLSSPDDLARALEVWMRPQQPGLLSTGVYRAAPLLPAAGH